MSKMLRGVAGRVAGKLLPQTTAAAGCAADCYYDNRVSGGQIYKLHCCYLPNCTLRCV
ncbi:hypothetical protein [Streptomyces sp. GQFP]|uniref:hypothetical protein n=1 Tax=Streptomyces sp. GQFP TaxID=2907545 RepID=UPI001F37985D|nr:hypothetical protein [Streptomyces sp. GQFP]UIX31009.1 hypothetical protein LUX31_13750 [Streptomyces sp. GQFP]